MGEDVSRSLSPGQQVIKIVHEELVATLGSEAVPLKKVAPPLTILMVGLQGSGKTTTAGKLARLLKSQGKKPLLVAADLQATCSHRSARDPRGTHRCAGVHRSQGQARPFGQGRHERGDPTGRDVVIVDTAGRLQIDQQLMSELDDVRKASDPDEVLLVVDAMTGQDAVNVASGFQEQRGADGRGPLQTRWRRPRWGGHLGAGGDRGPGEVRRMGEGLEDLEPFYPDRMASRILGMGDVMSLIEKAEATFDEAEAEKTAKKLQKGEFTLEDFLAQFQAMKRMGPLKDILALMPGSGSLCARWMSTTVTCVGRGDHSVDDSRRAPEPKAHRRQPKAPYRIRFGHQAPGRESGAQAVRRRRR